MGHIENIIATLKNDRIHSKQRFTTIFKWICDSIAILQLEIEKPRISSTSVYRQNPEVESTEDYFRVAIYNQLLDDVIQQLDFRFGEKTTKAANIDIMLPIKCVKDGV